MSNERMMHVFNMSWTHLLGLRARTCQGDAWAIITKAIKDRWIKLKLFLKVYILKYLFIYFCHTTQYVGSYFSDQRLNFCPPALEVWRLNRRTTRKPLKLKLLMVQRVCSFWKILTLALWGKGRRFQRQAECGPLARASSSVHGAWG